MRKIFNVLALIFMALWFGRAHAVDSTTYGVKYFYDFNRSNLVSGVKVERGAGTVAAPDRLSLRGLRTVTPQDVETLYIDDTLLTTALPIKIQIIDPSSAGFQILRDPDDGGGVVFSVDTRDQSYSLDPRVKFNYAMGSYLRLTDEGETLTAVPSFLDATGGVLSVKSGIVLSGDMVGFSGTETFKAMMTARGDSTSERVVFHPERLLVTDQIYTTGSQPEVISKRHTALQTIAVRDSITLDLLEGYGRGFDAATSQPVFRLTQKGALALFTTGTLTTGFADTTLSSGSLYAQNKVFAGQELATSGTAMVDNRLLVRKGITSYDDVDFRGDLGVKGDTLVEGDLTVGGSLSVSSFDTLGADTVTADHITADVDFTSNGYVTAMDSMYVNEVLTVQKSISVSGYNDGGSHVNGDIFADAGYFTYNLQAASLAVTGSFSGLGSLHNSGNVSTSGTLAVTGKTYAYNDMHLNGNLVMSGNQTLSHMRQTYSTRIISFVYPTSAYPGQRQLKIECYTSRDLGRSPKFTAATNDATILSGTTKVYEGFYYFNGASFVSLVTDETSGFSYNDVVGKLIIYVKPKDDVNSSYNQVYDSSDSLDTSDDYFVKTSIANTNLPVVWSIQSMFLMRP